MKIVYLLRVHRGPLQVARLVEALRHDGVRFLVHVDAKVDDAPFRHALEARGAMDDIRFTSRRFTANWGGWSLVETTLHCLREALAGQPGEEPDRVFLISGQDYPLISNAAIVDFMDRHPDTEFMSYGAMPPTFWEPAHMDRIRRYHFYDWAPLVWPANTNGNISRRKTVRLWAFQKLANWLLPKRSLPDGFKPYGGSAWWCLTGAGARQLLALADANPRLARFYRYSLHAEESYFQTLLLNSDMDPKRIHGEYLSKKLGDYLWFVDWQVASPRILREGDLDVLLASNRMFARKFDAGSDGRILDLIDEARPGHSLR